MIISISTMPAGKEYLQYMFKVQEFADFMHLDVCDGEYNSTRCFLPEYAKEINSHSTIPLDCHLMTKKPLHYAKLYAACSVNILTAQLEAFGTEKEVDEFISFVKSKNILVGLALEPKTDIKRVLPYLSKLDIVLVMSVQTGKSGQEFQKTVLSKIEYLANLKASFGYNYKIEVDGGITDKTASLVKQKGAEIIVSGSYVYNSNNVKNAIKSLRWIVKHIYWMKHN